MNQTEMFRAFAMSLFLLNRTERALLEKFTVAPLVEKFPIYVSPNGRFFSGFADKILYAFLTLQETA
jgi:hypothetical protein